MLITRAQIEQRLIVLHGTNMARVGMDVSSSGTNAYLDQPLMEACAITGLNQVNPLVVTNPDVSQLAGGQLTRYINAARWVLVGLIITRWPEARLATGRDLNIDPDLKVDGRPMRDVILKDALAGLMKECVYLEAQVRNPTPMVSAPTVGRLIAGRGAFRGRRGGFGFNPWWGQGGW